MAQDGAGRGRDDMAALAVVIPHFEDPERLARCLAALVAGGGPEAEIVVVDNGSRCDLSALRAAHPAVRFVTEPRKGAAAARNRGVAETRAPRIAFLDCDCVPGPGCLARAAATPLPVGDGPATGPRDEEPRRDRPGRERLPGKAPAGDGLVGGRIDTFDETPPPRSAAQAFEAVFAFRQAEYIAHKGFSVTANLVASRRAAEATGPMIVGLSEDMDWCHRARAAGFALAYDPALVVAHPSRADLTALAAKWR